jgi:hypothetical protein
MVLENMRVGTMSWQQLSIEQDLSSTLTITVAMAKLA